jgi:hypothetical protein
MKQQNGYIGFYERRRYEVHADSLLAAKQAVIAAAKRDFPRHGERRLAANSSVMLAEQSGQPVIHVPAD